MVIFTIICCLFLLLRARGIDIVDVFGGLCRRINLAYTLNGFGIGRRNS